MASMMRSAPKCARLALGGRRGRAPELVVDDALVVIQVVFFSLAAAPHCAKGLARLGRLHRAALIQTKGGKKLLSVAPKDGHLYGFDLATNTMLYRTPTTRIENAEAPFATAKAVHFCPGTVGRAEWNGPAYDPQTNLILIGEVDWCATVTLQKDKDIQAVSPGKPWSAMATISPYDTYGVPDLFGDWAGWVYAADADTGVWKWRLKSNYPILSGMTPTAGGIVFFGDMGGNFYALNAANGQRLWGQKIGGAIGGGVITYTANGAQRVAVATGFTSILWPTEVVTGKITILGLADALASR